MTGHGDFSVLEVRDLPEPSITGPGQVLVSLRAAALNHLDLWTVRGLPGLELSFPHILGGDGAGVVSAVSSDVRTVKIGERVVLNPGISCYECEYCRDGEHSLCLRYRLLGEHLPGTLCESIVVPGANVATIPEETTGGRLISWAEAASFTLATLTAWRMVVTRARVRPGETVLIWGIGGGVAVQALAVARLVGARVIVTSSSDAKLTAALEMGAEFAFNHARHDVAREVRSVTGQRGADVVIDNVGEATWTHSLRALAKQGRLVTCGGTTGPNVVTDVRRLFWHQYTIMGSTMGNAHEFREIVELFRRGALSGTVDSTVHLNRGRDAFERLASGVQMGKITVEI
jgi:NADPH:quinone reductase-like Zn-dependent oxidoreductase